jgi:hypothetical protein
MGESIEPAASGHQTTILKMPQGDKQRTVTLFPGETSRMWVTPHQPEQSRLDHASP